MTELLPNNKLGMLKHVRDTKTKLLLKDLHDRSIENGGYVVVQMKEKFMNLTINIIVRMLAWKRYFGSNTNGDEESGRFQMLWEISSIYWGYSSFQMFCFLVGWIMLRDM